MKKTIMNNDLWRLSACEVAEGIRTGKFSSREVVEDCLERINNTNAELNALTEIFADKALQSADAADAAVAKGDELGRLHGVPVSIKINVDLAGSATVNGSMALKDNIAKENSPAVQNWLNAGAVIVGRSNCPEFCVRWETNNEVYGQTSNPWNSKITPGGSSGGAAASIAAGMTPLAHGTDIGGSLRQPAQVCGVASIRSTVGRIPDYVPTEHEASLGSQLMNTDGPMARRIADVRLGLQAMAVGDWRDPFWVPAPLSEPEPSELPIAVIVDPLAQGVHEQVASGVEHAKESLKLAGYQTEHAEPATLADAVAVWQNVMIFEIFSGLEPAVKDFCGSALLQAFERYRAAFPETSAEKYNMAFVERRRVLRDWMGFFQQYSVMVAPVSTNPPQLIDFDIARPESTAESIQSMRMVVAINALGLPSVIVPVGVKDGLPQAVQVIGAPYQEMRCLEVAEAIEKNVEASTPIDPK
ncbi:MAG: amidase [Gammaproteobacteria bacterium]|nr:amidase [Gammaproteobacteria bacterium]